MSPVVGQKMNVSMTDRLPATSPQLEPIEPATFLSSALILG
jgi:hypothetical protein